MNSLGVECLESSFPLRLFPALGVARMNSPSSAPPQRHCLSPPGPFSSSPACLGLTITKVHMAPFLCRFLFDIQTSFNILEAEYFPDIELTTLYSNITHYLNILGLFYNKYPKAKTADLGTETNSNVHQKVCLFCMPNLHST